MADVKPEDEARMIMLRGLNMDGPEIAERTGWSESTVYEYLNEHEERAKAADDVEAYYWKTVTAALYDEDFREMVAGYLSDGGS